MSFDIFGEAQKDSIRVGYISTDRGFVDNVSVCEANRYAQLNPGTQFVFKTRKFIRYLNINEVNSLTPNDISSNDDTCTGIILDQECGPAEVFFYGGGGVGVQANPIIGEDGSLLAVDLVSGGFGYQYPPIVEVKDSCGIGAGAVVRAVLGEVIETVEYYDQEDDFENYNFDLCSPEEAGYGLRYSPDGSVIGIWDPTLYANFKEDPIRREIQAYQDFLQKLQKPWWTTRKEAPLRTVSENKTTRTKFDVTFEAWNDFMNAYAISPVPPSNVKGSDFAGIPFTFEWEEDFPYDGEYIFRGLCDNKATLYLDNIKLQDIRGFTNAPIELKKTIKSGVHRIRIDLFNIPIEESQIETKKVFDTVDYINKSNRQLWKTNNIAGKDSDFANQYGVLPFDPNSARAQEETFTGTHSIIWNNIKFPEDGNYSIEVMVDDDATLTFIGPQGETVITKRGFTDQVSARSTGKTIEVKEFSAGNYTLRVDLQQSDAAALAKGNPMFIAIKIDVTFLETGIVSPKSWNENPMGVSFSIDAPDPPIPQEPIPEQEGRCPRNPIWTTRFPNAQENWYPVVYDDRWSNFMNRYALSPLPPLSTQDSDGAGVVYRNSWDLDIPYDGFYALRGTVDNFGKIFIDNREIISKSPGSFGNLNGFAVENPDSTKVFLTTGLHKISVEVENLPVESYTTIDKLIFDSNNLVDGAVYQGPTGIATYRTGFISPKLQDVNADPNDEIQGKTWVFKWGNVDFPEDGQYVLEAEADDLLIVKIDGVEVGQAKVFEGRNKTNFNISKGKRTVELVLSNAFFENTGFNENPVVGFAKITKAVRVRSDVGKPWTDNPVAISAILIPPPCPKRIRGKGVVTRVDVDDPGNSYPPPTVPSPVEPIPTYPVALRLDSVKVLDPGINYNSDIDPIVVEPNNGVVLEYETDTFGRVTNVNVANPGFGFTRYPNIRIISPTGINATFAPQFEVVRDPIVSDPDTLIQVTDLVGLKQTGYVDGRPYYGAVFYKEGLRYAGFYETIGDLVQVYDTLKESIDAQVTTPPSAIIRQGTDITGNDPNLNIPGSPNGII
jgi:hypothetical protein